ncbi:helix-turn-helix domain-containing protein [Thermomicrobiaceae bacterium CFH 74404]|uniref:Helix-turn-helix domain-containing protein n=1 Tax=Thermalbibacter longus TaxID=2951981 RepID=A0AA42BC24_9BACT|nr:helix-turn-helix domain-containing protein [Thermalbibacter longus]MCM8748353.1 helix-turn-helix domain-containing protein [Thermalbibacter longus]
MELREGEQIELKRQWTDEALKDLAAFANTRGGTLYIGIADDGEVIGTETGEEHIRRIVNVIRSRLGIAPSVQIEEVSGRPVIAIQVEPVRELVHCNGRYLRRVGNTNRDFTPEELTRRVLEHSALTWNELPTPWGPDRVDREAHRRFASLARDRLPQVDPEDPILTLKNLGLIRENRLTRAGALLFAERPQELFPQARLRVGVFKGVTEIADSHEFEGTLWAQLEGATERFRRLLQVRFEVTSGQLSLEGLRRQEVWEYPLPALREAMINALIHRDYTLSADVQIRLYDDRLEIWSPGGLPPGITIDDLRQPGHPSYPRNPLLARAFYFANLIEQWGTGTTRIIEQCRQAGLPEPEFREDAGGVRVVFINDLYTPTRLRKLGLQERQIQAVVFVRHRGSITNREYRQLTGVSNKTAYLDLNDLVQRGILVPAGEGRHVRYELKVTEK